MMIDRPAAAATAAAIAPITLPRSVRQRIFLYLGILIILLAFGAPSGGLMDIPISFFLLKTKLHLKAHEVSLQAHRKMGMRKLGTFIHESVSYIALSYSG